MMKTLLLVALTALIASAAAQDLCFKEGWKIKPGTYFQADDPRPTYGTFFNSYNHKEYLWIHSGRNIDLYLLDGLKPGEAPTLTSSINSGSSCYTADSFIIGDDVYTYHGNSQFCTCFWRPSNPCPSELKIQYPGVTKQIKLSSNRIVPVDTVPDVTAPMAIPVADGVDGSPPNYACTPLINADEMKGKFCLADRGGCLFQDKYDNCIGAGAVAAIVVNRSDAIFQMGVTVVAPTVPFFMIGKGDAQELKDQVAMGKTVILTAGQRTGPPFPLPQFSSPDPLGVVNIFTGKRDLDTAPFLLAETMLYDYKNKLLYAFGIDGIRPQINIIMNATAVVDGTYPVIGSFPSTDNRSSWSMLINDAGTFIIEMDPWNDKFYMWDLNNPTSPRIVATTFLTKWCPLSNWRYSGPIQVHPSGNYAYAAMGLRQPASVCGDGDGDGIGGDYMQEIYDVSNPYFPRYIRSFPMNAVEQGAVTLNGGSWAWGPNGLAGISSTSGGFFLFDFSNPLFPVQASEVYDPAENQNDFTRGVLDSRYGDDGFWYLYELDGESGTAGEFHQLKAVPCGLPDSCL
jgi:hypothetical protein